ncbi:MAG: hypothetical protein U5K37_03975 [Natrialbaceae archaeon]|nr:hypothetical protein [Natrialbaceae archaeon]
MSTNSIEDNLITRFILGFAVILAMTVGGGAVGGALSALQVPYGAWVGVAFGALVVFAGFVGLYRRYDATGTTE